jgi:KDO2-lipid IV(A) lauroyltransferase
VTFRHRLEYGIVRLLIAVVGMLPDAAVRGMGAALGAAFYTFDRAHRRTAERNLATAFPGRPESERRAIAREAFKHFGRLLFEILKFSTLTTGQMLERVEVQGEEHVRAAHAQGNGVLLMTGHFGYWEIHGICHGGLFEPIGVLARTLDNPRLNQLLEDIRGRFGNFVIYRRGTIRRVMRALDAGQGVAILIDQHIVSRDAIAVDFFSRAAATTPVVAALALRTGAPVVPVFAFPLPHGRYRLVYDHPVEPPPADSPDAIREFTQRCTDVLEMYVRRNPELWLWMHRRWRDDVPADDAGQAALPAADQE